MEENSLNNKIKKQLEFIKEQISRFKRGFQGKEIKSHNFTPYLQALNKVFDLNNSYGQDYFELIEKKSLNFLLKNNRDLMKDVCFKLKGLSVYLQQSKMQPKEKEKKNDGICKICHQLIDSKNVEDTKNSLQEIGINKLKKMLKMIQQQSNIPTFTEQEDVRFFQQLHKVLNKKQSILAITENNLEKYLQEIMKNMEGIKQLEGLKDTSFPLPQQIDWQTKIKNQINDVLLGSFKGKVPIWIQKTFDYFIKLHSKFIRQLKQSTSCQTQPFSHDEVQELKNRIQHYKQQQQMNKSINQDYLKLLEEKKVKIQSLQIQINALKGHSNQRDLKIGQRVSGMSNVKDQVKSYKNQQLKNNDEKKTEVKIEIAEKVSQRHRFKKTPKNSSLISNSVSKSTFIEKIIPTQQSQFMTLNQKKNFGKQIRREFSVTQHLPSLPSTVLEEKFNRKKQKKLTDVEYFQKIRSNSASKEFLPNLQKLLQDSKEQLKSQENLKQVKKSSIFSSHHQTMNNSRQRQEIDQNLEISGIRQNASGSMQRIENHQNSLQYVIQSELNLTQNELDQEREVRVKNYKQKVSDIQSQLSNKVLKIDALKKTFEIKKINSSTSFTSKISPLYKEFSPISMMGGQRFASSIIPEIKLKSQMKTTMTQTQNQESQSIIMNQTSDMKVQKKRQKAVRIAQNSQGLKHKNLYKTEPNEGIKSEVSMKQNLLQGLQNNQNFLKISQYHLQTVLNKLLNYDNKNEFNNLPIKSIRAQIGKSNEVIRDEKSLNKSRFKKMKSAHSQQKDEKVLANQGSLPNLFEMKQIALKQKFKWNLSTRDLSPTTKSKKSKAANEGAQCLPNITSDVQTITKKNQVCSFTKKDFSLFLNEQNSFRYESNMMKKYHKAPSIELTKEQVQNLTSVYNLTQIIKSHSQQDYSQIISFVKYPYHSVVNNFSILNIVKDISRQSWLRHFSMIKYYHQKCTDSRDGNNCICGHIEKFVSKIEDMVVSLVKPKIVDQDQIN